MTSSSPGAPATTEPAPEFVAEALAYAIDATKGHAADCGCRNCRLREVASLLSTAPNPEPAYVCPQCGPDPAGADKHAATHHTWPPANEDASNPEPARCGVTTEFAMFQGAPVNVFRCDREPGHGGEWHDGASTDPSQPLARAAWPVVPAAASATTADDSSTRLDHWVARAKTAEAALAARDAELGEALDALTDLVVKATPYGTQDGEFVATYILPTGPIHRAIPLLQERHGITARPGFDPRKAAS